MFMHMVKPKDALQIQKEKMNLEKKKATNANQRDNVLAQENTKMETIINQLEEEAFPLKMHLYALKQKATSGNIKMK